jgi:EAL domain-containing protein (putative c-di-GMP-specific phosphodiesterase class I)/CheY-like chemotaxis protein
MPSNNADLTALVVDDSPSIRELVCAMLEDLGVGRVMQAEDGVSAFQKIEQSDWPVDLLFCDLAMPGVDGVETMRGLATRRLEAGIVLLSGMDPKLMATVADMAEQLGLRVLGTIPKPFRQPQIAAMIEKFRRARAIPSRRPALMITREELDEALHADRIDVYYQPKIRLSDGVVTGVEALARMHHPAYGVIEPDAFIPLAEESVNRITRLTLSVLERAIAQAGAWQRGGLDLGMAINMSTLAIRRLDLPDIVEAMAQKSGVANDRITLELTESQVMGSAEILHIISRFRLRGFKLSIDDYGTGHSSLKRLKRLPFTELKIDRSFVNGASSDADMRSILETSVDLGRRLRMDVVAEGVESWVDWHLLEEMGCDIAQGYVAARPVPATGVPLFAQRWAEHLRH